MIKSVLLSIILFLCCTYSDELIYKSFLSPPVTLYPGQIANTDPSVFPELDWPRKPMAVRYLRSEVVDEQGVPVPLYDLYIHHWLLYVNLGKNSFGWCDLFNVWGIGAEMRGVVYEYPSPYGVVFDGSETWSVNFHFIRTDTVPQEDMQNCIECHCADGTPTHPHGALVCCPDQSFCWGMQNTTEDPRKYYLNYTIGYVEIKDNNLNNNSIIPLITYSFDVLATTDYNCYIEYDISSTEVANNNFAIKQNSSTVPQDMNVILIETHQHIGGVNYTIDHYRDHKKIGTLCSAAPQYGNGTEVSNEKGYVVNIPTCKYFDQPYQLLKGDVLHFISIYNGTHIEGGSSYHEGVMGLVLLYAQRTGPSTCESKFKTLCGNPLPASTDECYTCAKRHIIELELAHCGSKNNGYRQIQFLCLTDNGYTVPYPINDTNKFF